MDFHADRKQEIPNAAVEGPKIMIYCVAIGTFTGFVCKSICRYMELEEALKLWELTDL